MKKTIFIVTSKLEEALNLIMDNEDLDFAIEQELRFEGPPSLFVVYNMSKEQILLLLEQYPKTLKFKIIS